MTIATQSSWKILPAPQSGIPLDLEANFTAEDFLKIKEGYIPKRWKISGLYISPMAGLIFIAAGLGFLYINCKYCQKNRIFCY
jgi:hypothetical protein